MYVVYLRYDHLLWEGTRTIPTPEESSRISDSFEKRFPITISASDSSGTGAVASSEEGGATEGGRKVQVRIYAPQAMAIVSHYAQLTTLRQCLAALHHLAQSRGCNSGQGVHLARHIRRLVTGLPLPLPGVLGVRLRVGPATIQFGLPPFMPSTKSNLPLSFLFELLDAKAVVTVLSAVLTEQRMIFVSSSLSVLTLATQLILQLLHPLSWW